MAESKLLVKTTLGNTILDLETRVNVHVKDDIYLQKEAIDLNGSELVVFQKEYIQTTLDEVEPYLELSPRYMHAKKQINEQDSQGKFIPLLRTELWRGLLKKQCRYDASLEEIIKKEAQEDFNENEYNKAIGDISNLLDNEGIEISTASIRNWLKGEIYCPREWRIFTALSMINPVFREFDETNRSYDGKHYNYKFFVIARQTIMRYLAKMKGEELKIRANVDDVADSNHYNIRLNEEIDSVVKSLMEEKGKDYALARITGIEMLHPKHPWNKEVRKNPEHKLSKGILYRKSADLEIKSKDMNEFFKDFAIINSTFSSAFDIYLNTKYKEKCGEFSVKDEEGNIIRYQEGIKQFLLHKYNEPQNYVASYAYERMKDYLSKDSLRLLEEASSYIIDAVFSGEMDNAFDLPINSFKKLFEINYKLKMLRPRIMLEYEKVSDEHEVNMQRADGISEKPYKSEADMYMLSKLYNECRPIHDKLMRLEKKMAEKFPISFVEQYHGVMHVKLLKNNSKTGKEDVERVMKTYELGEFKEIFVMGYSPLYGDIIK